MQGTDGSCRTEDRRLAITHRPKKKKISAVHARKKKKIRPPFFRASEFKENFNKKIKQIIDY